MYKSEAKRGPDSLGAAGCSVLFLTVLWRWLTGGVAAMSTEMSSSLLVSLMVDQSILCSLDRIPFQAIQSHSTIRFPDHSGVVLSLSHNKRMRRISADRMLGECHNKYCRRSCVVSKPQLIL